MQRMTLSNGLRVILAEHHAIPVVNFHLLIDAGFAADQDGIPGLSSLTMEMMDEGTKHRNALEISEELAMLGATLRTDSNLDMSNVRFSALKENLTDSLDILADVILNPSFPETDFQRLKRERLVQIKQEMVRPNLMALRALPRILYGKDHAYGNSFTGSGTEESVARITRDDLVNFHRTWVRPNNATLVVTGDTRLEELKPELERQFGVWKRGETPRKDIETVAFKSGSTCFLLDRPGALQSVIFAGHIVPPKANPNEVAIEVMNTILGGNFTARINMNLREDKHWTYGARSRMSDARGQRPFFVSVAVQNDKAKESMVEIRKELDGMLGSRPITDDELDEAKAFRTLTLPGRWETSDAVADSITEIVTFELDEKHFETYPSKVRSLSLRQIQDTARKTIHLDKVVWVVVGDRAKIEPGIRELDFCNIKVIDANGNEVQD